MFDCGMHMGYNDSRRFPDFSFLGPGPLTDKIDLAIISHFHLDHCGALPYFSELVGYNGTILMTFPTKAICPILLEDYRKITVDRKGETNFFTSEDIRNCMKKVKALNLHQTIIINGIEVKPYYAGHVLGAGMFYVRVGNKSVVYTGDYNMTPDRHLGAAWIDRCEPDVVITESTYATTVRDSKRCRERDFLQKVHRCVMAGGKVLIPVFAVGRAQELCILLESFWERNNLKVPIYFSAGLTERANHYYKLFISWTNQKLKDTFVERNMFDFKHIQPFDRAFLDHPGPQVLFATPGMLHAGLSLQAFVRWAGSPRNMVILPGYCVAGTVGAKVIAGHKKIEIDRSTTVHVKLAVEHLSFSAHADAKGIMQLISMCGAKNVVLVHGEKKKMTFLADRIQSELGKPCFFPPNGELLRIAVQSMDAVSIPLTVVQHHVRSFHRNLHACKHGNALTSAVGFSGTVVQGDNGQLQLVADAASGQLQSAHRVLCRRELAWSTSRDALATHVGSFLQQHPEAGNIKDDSSDVIRVQGVELSLAKQTLAVCAPPADAVLMLELLDFIAQQRNEDMMTQ